MGGKGGSSTVVQMDPEYAASLSALTNTQTETAQYFLDFYKDNYAPYMSDVVAANHSLLPQQTEYQEQALGYQQDLLPQQYSATSSALNNYKTQQILGEESARLQFEQQKQEIAASNPVMKQFYAEAAKGPDYETAMGMASADVAQAYKTATGSLSRSAARMGMNPNSGAFAKQMANVAKNQAKDLAGARTSARVQEKNNAFSRLATGMQARGSATQFQGAGASTAPQQSMMGYTPGSGVVSSSGVGDTSGQANQFFGNAMQGSIALGQGNTTTTTKGSSSDPFGYLMQAGGIAAGLMMSSARFKEDIRPLEQKVDETMLERVASLRPVSFKYKGDRREDPYVGFIAEEVYEVLPQVVIVSPDGEIVGLDMSKIAVLAVAALQQARGEE